jgi:hypothetical protein
MMLASQNAGRSVLRNSVISATRNVSEPCEEEKRARTWSSLVDRGTQEMKPSDELSFVRALQRAVEETPEEDRQVARREGDGRSLGEESGGEERDGVLLGG